MSNTAVRAVIERLLVEIAPEADLAVVEPDENLRQALDIDSYDFLSFLVKLNRELGVEIPEADYGKLASLNQLESYLTARLKPNA